MSKETFYFSHDYNVRTDPKIKGLIRKHGMAGYGIYWALVEDLYNNANALQMDYDGIAYDLRTDSKIIKSIINDFDLFSIEDVSFGSKSVERRLDQRNEKSAKARESAYKRWGKNANASKKDANALRSECEGNAIKERKENKGKKRILFIPPTLDEVKDFFKEKGYTEKAAILAFNHYELGNWHDTNGKKVLNWKQKMSTNWFDEKNMIPAKGENKPMLP